MLKPGFDEREAAALPTLLGAAQKAWLLDALSSSDATWKILGSDVQLSRMLVDLRSFELLPEGRFKNLFYFSVDQWDGYRSERAELLRTIAGVDNVVAIAGDIHAFHGYRRPTRTSTTRVCRRSPSSTFCAGIKLVRQCRRSRNPPSTATPRASAAQPRCAGAAVRRDPHPGEPCSTATRRA